MLEFDLKDPGEGIWFPYRQSEVDPDDREKIIWKDVNEKENGKFHIRSIEPYIEERLKKESKLTRYEFVLNPKTRAMERVAFTPEKSFDEKMEETQVMFVYAILDWEGVGVKGGSVLEVSDENKKRLARNPEFVRFFDDCQKKLKEQSSEYKEQSEKN
jgi:hypothetical protein